MKKLTSANARQPFFRQALLKSMEQPKIDSENENHTPNPKQYTINQEKSWS
jgi:hypothetical protein